MHIVTKRFLMFLVVLTTAFVVQNPVSSSPGAASLRIEARLLEEQPLAQQLLNERSLNERQVPQAQTRQPIFRFPVVPGAVISGYFDHNQGNDIVQHFDGLRNASPNYGFIFTCSSVGMYDFVGCVDPVSGEGACSNDRELWYDGHKGTDYEYAQNWHTGAYCDPNRFSGITSPVYAPARGKVHFAGYDPYRPGNGWHIRLKHDLNANGNFDDDNFRSIYLHFTANALGVTTGQIVSEGQYLGLGGSTGYSSSPHLHFEVQRSSDYFQNTFWSVDPYGWQGQGSDPWPYQNVNLWRLELNEHTHLPLIVNEQSQGCVDCGSIIANGGFESGSQSWVENGVDIINHVSQPSLPVDPYAGEWLAWLGGRNNASDTLYQAFALPGGTVSANLRYLVRVDTTETSGVYDTFSVTLRDSSGSLLRNLDSVDNAFNQKGRWVERIITISDLAPWAGQSLRLTFEGRTDNSAVTHFYVDEVSITAH